MLSFIRRCFSGTRGRKGLPTHLHRPNVGLHVSLSSFRTHMDTAPPVQAVLLHDLFQSGHVWQQMMHELVGSLPLDGIQLTEPLELYCPDLRGHGLSDALPVDPPSFIDHAVGDLADALPGIIGRDLTPQTEREQPLHLCGMGLGAMLACQLALKYPALFSSVFLIVQDIPQLYSCTPSTSPVFQTLRSLQGKADSLLDLNEKLKTAKVMDDTERALLLANTKKGEDSKMYFRLDNTLFQNGMTLHSKCFDDSNSVYNGATFVLHQCALQDTEPKAFVEKFPNCRFGSVSFEDDKVMRLMLSSFGIVEEANPIKEGEAGSD